MFVFGENIYLPFGEKLIIINTAEEDDISNIIT